MIWILFYFLYKKNSMLLLPYNSALALGVAEGDAVLKDL